MQAKIFILCGFNPYKMFWLWVTAYFLTLMLEVGVEVVIWGEMFPHYFDIVINTFFLLTYLHYVNAMGEFLLKILLDKDKTVETSSDS